MDQRARLTITGSLVWLLTVAGLILGTHTTASQLTPGVTSVQEAPAGPVVTCAQSSEYQETRG